MNIDESLQIAVERHKSGNFPGAEALYRQILAEQPDHADALNLLGVLLTQTGRGSQAVELLQRAVSLRPNALSYQLNLGIALTESDQLEDAIRTFRQALAIQPEHPKILCNLSNALWKAGLNQDAIVAATAALSQTPNYFEAHNNLGNALQSAGKLPEAIAHFQRATTLRPKSAEAHANLASALVQADQYQEALETARHAVELNPESAVAHFNVGKALLKLEQPLEAADEFRRAIELGPSHAETYFSLGVALADSFNYPAAEQAWRKTIELDPQHPLAGSNLLFLLHYNPNITAQKLIEEHRSWANRHVPGTGAILPHANSRDPARRLRIGYISGDFRGHVVGRCILPILTCHDRSQFEIFCYSNHAVGDAMTARIHEQASTWREIHRLDDEELVNLVRSDAIDILVDLSLHTVGNRLLAMMHKPAPVQVSYLGYPSTTGSNAIDYRFSDPYLDSEGTDLSVYTEKTIRLPRTYWCYAPEDSSPEVGPAPATKSGYVTYGCLNNFGKVSPQSLDLWAQVLRKIPNSRLLMNCALEPCRAAVRQVFASNGVAADRLEFVPRQSWEEYLKTYNRIDVGLDTFPYGGAITMCDSLWMGVPVVTPDSARFAAGRGGVSVLHNLGEPELIAETPEDFVRIACEWRKWIELRPTLRQRMQDSPLMDAKSLTLEIEAAYRRMWRAWCASAPETVS